MNLDHRIVSYLTAAAAPAVLAVGAAALLAHRRFKACPLDMTLDDTDHPRDMLHLDHVDGSHTGPATAVLGERYLTAEPGTAEEASTLHGLALVSNLDDAPDRHAPSSSVLDTFDYEEIVRSFVEVINIAAENLAIAELGAIHAGHDPEECDGFDGDLVEPTAARYLIEAAITYEDEHESHLHDCGRCRAAGHDAPALIRARFCRDIADDLLTNADNPHVHVRGLPVQAAFDVATVLVEIIAEAWDESPVDQIQAIQGGLAKVISFAEHRDAA